MVEYPPVYEGGEPYIFISYAHKNSDMVLPIVSGLQDRGFRVWYDAGIETGTEWPEYIADHLASCGCAIIMVTEAALESHNCRREIHYAISQKVPMLVVYLEDVKMSRGMEMQLGVLQALFRSRHGSFGSFMDKLCSSALLEPCKVVAVVNEPDDKPVVSLKKPPLEVPILKRTFRDKHYIMALGILCAVLVVVGAVGVLFPSVPVFDYMHILVILGAVLLGPGAGAVLGVVFGLCSIWYYSVHLSAYAFVFSFSPFATNEGLLGVAKSLWIALGCRVLLGLVSGWLWKLAMKVKVPELLALPIISGVSAMLQALVVLHSVGALFNNWRAQSIALEVGLGAHPDVYYAIFAAVLVTVLYKLLQLLNRRLMKKKGL